MALIAFSLILNVQPRRPIGLSHRERIRTARAPHADAHGDAYHVLLQLSAENPHPIYDGDEYFEQVSLVRTQLVMHGVDYALSDEAFEIVRTKVLALLAELERSGWMVSYEQAYFRQLVLADNEKWHFQTLPSSHVLFHIWLRHPQKLRYSPDTGRSLLEWMRQSVAAG